MGRAWILFLAFMGYCSVQYNMTLIQPSLRLRIIVLQNVRYCRLKSSLILRPCPLRNFVWQIDFANGTLSYYISAHTVNNVKTAIRSCDCSRFRNTPHLTEVAPPQLHIISLPITQTKSEAFGTYQRDYIRLKGCTAWTWIIALESRKTCHIPILTTGLPTHTHTITPLRIMDTLTRSSMVLGVIWDVRCQSLRAGIGLREPLP